MVSAQHIPINGGWFGDALNSDPFSSEGGLVICEPSYCLKLSEYKVSIFGTGVPIKGEIF